VSALVLRYSGSLGAYAYDSSQSAWMEINSCWSNVPDSGLRLMDCLCLHSGNQK